MRTLDFLGQTFTLRNGGDALDMIERLSSAFNGVMQDLGQIGADVQISKTRLDYQSQGLRWIGAKLGNTTMAQGTFGGGGDGLAAVAALGLSGGLNGPPQTIPSITPNQGGGGGGGSPPVPSVHRSITTPPVPSGVNNQLNLLLIGGASDRTHIWKLQSNGGVIPAGSNLFQVTFGTPYTAVPSIGFTESVGSLSPGAFNQTQNGYSVTNNQAIQPGGGYFLYVVVTPSVENFD